MTRVVALKNIPGLKRGQQADLDDRLQVHLDAGNVAILGSVPAAMPHDHDHLDDEIAARGFEILHDDDLDPEDETPPQVEDDPED